MRQRSLRAQRQVAALLGGGLLLLVGGGCSSRCGGQQVTDADASAAADAVGVVAAPVDAAAESAAAAASIKRPLNVLLITIDSLRADMPWAGYERPIAPRLTKLYESSVRYSRAYSTSSFTSKSIPGILTGRYPSELARTGSFFTKYVDSKQFVCKQILPLNVPCVGAHAHMYFSPGQSGFESGFQTWKIVPGITFDYQTDPYVTSDKLTPIAIDTLASIGTSATPFFAWFHYMDPHDEYKTHSESPHFGKKARDLYDEEVFFTDLWIGKLLDYVASQPWAEKTAIVVSADHGELFGEHGLSRHAHELWEELIHVPLFFSIPGVKPRTIDRPRGARDLMPTFLDLLGLASSEPASELPGTSLLPEIQTGEGEERDVIADLPEDDYNERRRALIHGQTKIIAFGEDVRFSLFDLATDPKEQTDLILKSPDLASEMKQRYREASKKIKSEAPRGGIPGKTKKE